MMRISLEQFMNELARAEEEVSRRLKNGELVMGFSMVEVVDRSQIVCGMPIFIKDESHMEEILLRINL